MADKISFDKGKKHEFSSFASTNLKMLIKVQNIFSWYTPLCPYYLETLFKVSALIHGWPLWSTVMLIWISITGLHLMWILVSPLLSGNLVVIKTNYMQEWAVIFNYFDIFASNKYLYFDYYIFVIQRYWKICLMTKIIFTNNFSFFGSYIFLMLSFTCTFSKYIWIFVWTLFHIFAHPC